MPVIGYLNSKTEGASLNQVLAFRQGLSEAGFVEGRNLAIEYRWAEGQLDRLPLLAADLARRRVAAMFTEAATTPSAMAATSTIPIVFVSGPDPVEAGFVTNLNRPGGHGTGVGLFGLRTWSKAAGADARDRAKGCRLRRARTSDLSVLRAVHQRREGGRPHIGIADRGLQCVD